MKDLGISGPDRDAIIAFILSCGIGETEDTLRAAIGLPAGERKDGAPQTVHWPAHFTVRINPVTIEIKPAVRDAKGDVVSPAEVDPLCHMNIRCTEEQAALLEKGGTIRNALRLAKRSDEAVAASKPIRNRTLAGGITVVRLNMRRTPRYDDKGNVVGSVHAPELAEPGEVRTPHDVWI